MPKLVLLAIDGVPKLRLLKRFAATLGYGAEVLPAIGKLDSATLEPEDLLIIDAALGVDPAIVTDLAARFPVFSVRHTAKDLRRLSPEDAAMIPHCAGVFVSTRNHFLESPAARWCVASVSSALVVRDLLGWGTGVLAKGKGDAFPELIQLHGEALGLPKRRITGIRCALEPYLGFAQGGQILTDGLVFAAVAYCRSPGPGQIEGGLTQRLAASGLTLIVNKISDDYAEVAVVAAMTGGKISPAHREGKEIIIIGEHR